MRTHGTLTRWNDDRGFGFITPAKGTGELFVHISAFPRDGKRPRIDELISFEVENGPDGRPRAVRVMRPAPRHVAPHAAARPRSNPPRRRLGGAFALLAIAGIGAYGYAQYSTQIVSEELPASDEPAVSLPSGSGYSCDGRTMCPQMTSCEEATYFIRHCPNTQMDGDGDGVPCESQWCK
jgi:cold shock CspA family protein